MNSDVTIVNVALPAMTAAVVSSAGAEHAGVASGILNAARQSGGALGVALLGSLLGSGAALSLHLPLAVAAGGYLVAVALAAITIRGRTDPAGRSRRVASMRDDGRLAEGGLAWLARPCGTPIRRRSVRTGCSPGSARAGWAWCTWPWARTAARWR